MHKNIRCNFAPQLRKAPNKATAELVENAEEIREKMRERERQRGGRGVYFLLSSSFLFFRHFCRRAAARPLSRPWWNCSRGTILQNAIFACLFSALFFSLNDAPFRCKAPAKCSLPVGTFISSTGANFVIDLIASVNSEDCLLHHSGVWICWRTEIEFIIKYDEIIFYRKC